MSRPGTEADHLKFCEREGWTPAKTATGKQVAHHATFKLTTPDGRRLRTRVSRPADNTTYGPQLWHEILSQLDVTEDQFWDCLDNRVLPERSAKVPAVATLPIGLIRQLEQIGVPADEAVRMSIADATAHIADYWLNAAR